MGPTALKNRRALKTRRSILNKRARIQRKRRVKQKWGHVAAWERYAWLEKQHLLYESELQDLYAPERQEEIRMATSGLARGTRAWEAPQMVNNPQAMQNLMYAANSVGPIGGWTQVSVPVMPPPQAQWVDPGTSFTAGPSLQTQQFYVYSDPQSNTTQIHWQQWAWADVGTAAAGAANVIYVWDENRQAWEQRGPDQEPLTPEQLEAYRRQQAEQLRQWEEQQAKARAESEAAEKRAQELIQEVLDEDARRQLKEKGYIEVEVTRGTLTLDPVTGKVEKGHNSDGLERRFQGAFKFYRIQANAGVYLLNEERLVKGYLCIHTCHPEGVLPPSDDLIAKYWTAKHDEERLWAIANYSPR